MDWTHALSHDARVVAYYPRLAQLTGSVTAAVLLSQLGYWTNRQHDPEGWIYKTQQDLREETGLSRKEQETARRVLVSLGFISEKREGLPARLFYRVNPEAINAADRTNKDAPNGHTGVPQTGILDSPKRAIIHTQNTTQITSEMGADAPREPDWTDEIDIPITRKPDTSSSSVAEVIPEKAAPRVRLTERGVLMRKVRELNRGRLPRMGQLIALDEVLDRAQIADKMDLVTATIDEWLAKGWSYGTWLDAVRDRLDGKQPVRQQPRAAPASRESDWTDEDVEDMRVYAAGGQPALEELWRSRG